MSPKKLNIEIGSGIRILSPSQVMRAALRKATTHANPMFEMAERYSPYGQTSIDPEIRLYEETEDYIKVPRGFDVTTLPPILREKMKQANVTDMRNFVPVTFPKPLLAPNEEQQQILQAVNYHKSRALRPNGNYMVVASTSVGKTIGQALMARFFSQRTLVLCKTNLIQKAWILDLQKLFGIEKKDIGIIQQKKHTIGKHFTLSSLATLHRRQHLWEEIFSQFGTIILDECHILPAQQIYTFVSYCPAAYVIGATATEKRKDGKHFMMHASFGKPVKRITAVKNETANSMPIKSVLEIPTEFRYQTGASQDLDYNALLESLIGDDDRNEKIAEAAARDWRMNRSVLITSSRLAHCELLKEMMLEKGVKDASLLTGEVNARHRESSVLVELICNRGIRCIIATDQTISTGANLPPLDRLHIGVPIKDQLKLAQLLGRIRRKHPGKVDALVRYYKDVYTPYLMNIFKNTAVPVFRQMEIQPYKNMFIC